MFDKAYWENKYKDNKAGWNAQSITTPIKEYIDQLTQRELRILVPGLGHGHELYYLHQKGFKNIHGLDLTPAGVNESIHHYPDFPKEKVFYGDFFDFEGTYDLILEQTFFCALDPGKRKDYVLKMNNLLSPGGKLVGVLFDDVLGKEGPPFGGTITEYKNLFQPLLHIKKLERAYNSIKPRQERELFIIIEKQHHD